MSKFDIQMEKLAQALALINNQPDEQYEHDEPEDGHAHDEIGGDELDVADHVLGALPEGTSTLDQKVSLRDRKWIDLNRIAKFARANPPSVLQGTIGGQQKVSVGQNAQVAFWSGEDSETIPVTVTFAPVQQVDIPAAALAPARPYGIVQFGTRGFLTKLYVDIGRGVQFTVNASEVTLQVGVETFSGAPSEMLLSGMLSFYPTTQGAPVTRTLYFDDVAMSTFPITPLPPFARGIMVETIQPAGVGPQITITFYDSKGTGAVAQYSYPATAFGAPFIPPAFIPIPGDAAFFALSSNTLVPPFDQTTVRAIFQLAV